MVSYTAAPTVQLHITEFPTNDIILSTNIFIIFQNVNLLMDQDNRVIEVLKRPHGTESKLVPNRSIKISFY